MEPDFLASFDAPESELINIPADLIHEPYKLSSIEQQLYKCEIGKDYPFPIVNVEETRKYASDIVWSFRKNAAVKTEGKRILEKHVNNPKSHLTKTKKILLQFFV